MKKIQKITRLPSFSSNTEYQAVVEWSGEYKAIFLNVKKKELCKKVSLWEIYPRKELKLIENPLATLEWITSDHTLSK